MGKEEYSIRVRLTEEEKSVVDVKLTTEKVSGQSLLYGWLMDWLGGKREKAPGAGMVTIVIPEANANAHRDLEEILTAGSKDDVRGIRQICRRVAESVRNRTDRIPH